MNDDNNGLIREARAHLMGLTYEEILDLTQAVLAEKIRRGEALAVAPEGGTYPRITPQRSERVPVKELNHLAL